MSHRTLLVAAILVGLCTAASAGRNGLGVTVPEPGFWRFTALAADSSGAVFAFEGDTLYHLQGGSFDTLVGGLENKVWPGQEIDIDPSGFAVNPAGTLAYVATGMSGRIVEINIDSSSATFGAARELTGAAMGANGLTSNYGLAVDPASGHVFLTDSYSADLYLVGTQGAGSLTLMKSFPGGIFGSGIAFGPTGNLVVPVARGYSAWPDDDNYPVDLWTFDRAFLDAAVPGGPAPAGGTLLVSNIQVSGSGFAAMDAAGNTYIQATDGIYTVDPTGAIGVLDGNIAANAFDMVGYGFMGLAYDAPADRLLYAWRDDPQNPWELQEYVLPEPATLALVAVSMACAAIVRRPRRRAPPNVAG